MSRTHEDAFVHTTEQVRSRVSGFLRLTAAERIEKVSYFLDEAFRVPVFGLRVGLDPILSVIPFLGSWFGVVLSAYFIWEAWNLRVPWHVYPRMLMNIGVDAILGAVPVAGVVADAFFKANVRNRRLLLRYVAKAKKAAEARHGVEVFDKDGRPV